MKPIRLIFSGINSYRALQKVDFETLGADGLFGIFGPTGSGKSSILDAITLALYGEVDRASNNTRGIINQLEKSLEVSFEFELGKDRYLVERRYDRNPKDPEAAMAKQARLRMLDPAGEEVLASKPQEATAKVEEILGIGKDEFSRAVVLPQGKFDQFLRLTGGDRATMLEHLFNLEQYGEGLVAKVKNEMAIHNEQLQRIEGEEQGLGDCSDETLQQGILDLKAKNKEFLSAQKAFEEVDKTYKEAEAVRELFLKLKTAVDKFNQLKQDHEKMDEKQTRLNTAERAEPLRELISRQKGLDQRINEESISYQKKVISHSDAVTKHNEANRYFENAESEYKEQLPQLHARKAQYQGAQKKLEKLKDIHLNFDEKKQELDLLVGEIANNEKEMATCKSLLDEKRVTLEALQQERSKLMVNPDERESIERALTALGNLEESEKRRQESFEIYSNRKTQNDDRWAALIEIVHKMLPEQIVSASEDLEQYSKLILNRVEKELDEARKEQQQALIANSAAELVKELHDGEPCPVCGSREHPLPAKVSNEIEIINNKIKVAENRLREVRIWEGQLIMSWQDWKANESLIDEARELMEKSEKKLQDAAVEFEKLRGRFERNQLRDRKQELTDFEKRIFAIDQEQVAIRRTQEELNEKLHKWNVSLQNDKIKEASLKEILTSSQTQLEDIAGELNQITGGKDLDNLIREMVQTYNRLQEAVDNTKRIEAESRVVMEKIAREMAALEATIGANRGELAGVKQRLAVILEKAGFNTLEEAEAVLLETIERQSIREELERYRQEVAVSQSELDQLERQINNRPFEETIYDEIKAKRETLSKEAEQLKTETALAQNKVEELQAKQERWKELQRQKTAVEKRKSLAEDLMSLLRGRRFVSFLAQEHLRDMTLDASYQLGRLTGQRYALELAKDRDCEFVIRDDYNGGARRTINSLSGGEVFMTSLALALALSSKIQLRGKYPLGFFFLDEGFGSLDEEKLDKVMSALEKLHDKHRMVGVISHVRELKERLPRYLEVVAAGEDGSGSRIKG